MDSYGSNEKLKALDQIENQVLQIMQCATQGLTEFAKDKPSVKNVESQVNHFLKALENVEKSVSEQLRYLSQTSTLQPHEGSSYSSMKVNQMASQRLEHVKSCLNELEHLKMQHQIQFQKYQNSKTQKNEAQQPDNDNVQTIKAENN